MLILLTWLITLLSFGQKDISGVYSNIAGRLIIKNDSLTLTTIYSPGIPERVLAKCKYKWMDDNFIEINSNPPYILVHNGLQIIESIDSSLTDSIRLSFFIPNYQGKLDISISGTIKYRYTHYDLEYSEKSREFMLPKNINSINISISNPVYGGELDGSYYSFVCCPVINEYEMKKNANVIEISIPAIDDSFFEKYYVKGDYAKISKDTITWKGEVFVKKK
jgi:hypothetical protein